MFFRFASFSSLVNYFSGIGIEDGCEVLTRLLSEADQPKVDLVCLSKQMVEELVECADTVLTARASLSCLLGETLHLRSSLEATASQRDRLTSELMVRTHTEQRDPSFD